MVYRWPDGDGRGEVFQAGRGEEATERRESEPG